MKKMLLVTVILAVIFGVCVTELVYTNHIFNDLLNKATELNVMLETLNEGIEKVDEKKSRSEKTLIKSSEIIKQWQEHKHKLMSFTHHHVVFELDRSIIRLDELVKIDHFADCKLECRSIINSLTEIICYNKVLIQNIL
ncbi:MAG: DUF4363 family protein [Clostridiales bacterium]|jgi:hypothetical protein|nr:DUF4363 family protein [Clostridiales bacterium]